jgi:hypothetical protein
MAAQRRVKKPQKNLLEREEKSIMVLQFLL